MSEDFWAVRVVDAAMRIACLPLDALRGRSLMVRLLLIVPAFMVYAVGILAVVGPAIVLMLPVIFFHEVGKP